MEPLAKLLAIVEAWICSSEQLPRPGKSCFLRPWIEIEMTTSRQLNVGGEVHSAGNVIFHRVVGSDTTGGTVSKQLQSPVCCFHLVTGAEGKIREL